MAFNISTISCFVPGRADATVRKMLSLYNPVACVLLGDMPYISKSLTAWGYSLSTLDKNSTEQDFRDHYDQFANHPAIKELRNSNILIYSVFDDHEWGGNDWDHSLVKANATPSINAITQADVNKHWKAGRDAHDYNVSTYYDNPPNTDLDAVVTAADRPENALLEGQDPPVSDYSVAYWRQGFALDGSLDNVAPHLEIFTLDCMSYMDDIEKVDDANKTRLGPSQLAWFKAHLASSTATFKMIVSSKNTYGVSGGSNFDDWDTYTTERDDILAFIAANSITGVFWVSGDQHVNNVAVQNTVEHTYDHFMLNPCPFAQVYSATTPTINTQTIWADKQQVFGLISVHQDYCDLSICNTATGKVLFKGSVLAGSNRYSVRDIPVAI